MKIATINMLLTICLVWAIVFYLIFYIPQRVYDNPAPVKFAYDIGVGAEEVAAVVPTATVTLSKRLEQGDLTHGRKLFGECATCHSALKGGKERVGPPLWGIVGQDFAASDTFGYSRAMRRARDEGKQWDFETLYIYLQAPQRFIKGTTMSYAGIKGEQDRADLILYLRSLADTLQPLPGVEDVTE